MAVVKVAAEMTQESTATEDPDRQSLHPGHHGSRPHSGSRRSGSRTPTRRSVPGIDLEDGWLWSHKVDDPWDPAILALDGGGIRGYSSLLILKRLFHVIHQMELELETNERTGDIPEYEDDLLPCHYFDFMYGTSTGGLISVMLGRLRMTIGECLAEYRIVGDGLFGRKRSSLPLRTRYSHEPLEEAVKRLVSKHNFGSLHPWDATTETMDSVRFGIETLSGRRAVVTAGDGPIRKALAATSRRANQQATTRTMDDIQLSSDTVYSRPMDDSGILSLSPEYDAAAGASDMSSYATMSRADSPFSSPKSTTSSFASLPRWNPDDPRVCQTCCLTATHKGSVGQAHLLRSYPLYYSDDTPNSIEVYNEGADPLEIWQVTRATSAAPFYFEMLQTLIDDEVVSFKDGGIRENNPSFAAYTEFQALYAHRAAARLGRSSPAVLLSIGTGRADTSRDGFVTNWPWPFGSFSWLRGLAKGLEKFAVIPALVIKFTESEEGHRHMLSIAEGEKTWYKRLNVSDGLEGMALDDWVAGEYEGKPSQPGGKTLRRMEEAATRYLDRERDDKIEGYKAPKEMIEEIAMKLVNQRRARWRQRESDGGRWDTYIGGDLDQMHERQK